MEEYRYFLTDSGVKTLWSFTCSTLPTLVDYLKSPSAKRVGSKFLNTSMACFGEVISIPSCRVMS